MKFFLRPDSQFNHRYSIIEKSPLKLMFKERFSVFHGRKIPTSYKNTLIIDFKNKIFDDIIWSGNLVFISEKLNSILSYNTKCFETTKVLNNTNSMKYYLLNFLAIEKYIDITNSRFKNFSDGLYSGLINAKFDQSRNLTDGIYILNNYDTPLLSITDSLAQTLVDNKITGMNILADTEWYDYLGIFYETE